MLSMEPIIPMARGHEHGAASERRSLIWLALAALVLVATSIGLIAYGDAQIRPPHEQSEGIDSGQAGVG